MIVNMNVALLLLCISPPQPVGVRASVDLAELNHYYDENGRLVFDQVIFLRLVARSKQVSSKSLETC